GDCRCRFQLDPDMSDYDTSRAEHSAKIKEGIRRSRAQKLEAKLAAAAEAAEAAEATEPSESATEPEQTPNTVDTMRHSEPEKTEPVDDALRPRTLEGIDPEVAALFTNEELAQYEADENAKAAAERKKKALED